MKMHSAPAKASTDQSEVNPLQSLSQAAVGQDLRILALEGSETGCEQLRRLGFCESLQVRKLGNGRNLVCSVCGTRMALSRKLADQVMVSPVGS